MGRESQTGGVRGTTLETGTGSWISGMIGSRTGGGAMGAMVTVPVIQGAVRRCPKESSQSDDPKRGRFSSG